MSMHGKNDRSVHTDHRTIARNLKRHAELMTSLIADGMSREAASREAFKIMQKGRNS